MTWIDLLLILTFGGPALVVAGAAVGILLTPLWILLERLEVRRRARRLDRLRQLPPVYRPPAGPRGLQPGERDAEGWSVRGDGTLLDPQGMPLR